MPIQVEITVGKKVSSEVDKHTWRTVHYQLSCNMGAENLAEVEAQKVEMEKVIDKWLEPHTGKSKVAPFITKEDNVRESLSEVPRFDIADIESLPWKKKGGELAGKSGWAWTFSDVKEIIEKHEEKDRALISELCHAIRKSENKLQLGDMIYSYGKNTKFLNRVPARRQSAR
ncbi:MAG: hypothetical protein E3J87_07170 [Candidatus Cloacimonadota bacterium]|nr:MAG: hypothetical protein E3J87_07170 [Candidatus Cloacimonadota bacterium]